MAKKRIAHADPNLEPLKRAVASLEEILLQDLDVYRRDGAIQRFEYTFELTWKALQRALKLQGVETGSPKQVFRAALKTGWIDAIEPWFEFLEARNLTTHTYNEDTAQEVFRATKKFSKYARQVLSKLARETLD